MTESTTTQDREAILRHARQVASSPPPSILQRSLSSWSGPPRAYYSVGKYAWPDPDSPDGLPYHRVDGAVNPAAAGDSYDWARMGRFVEECRALALAQRLQPDDRWLDALERRLHTWFVDEHTSIEPHLEHAAALPGVNDGMWVGIIEGACLISLVNDLDSLADADLLGNGSLVTAIVGVRAWMRRFAQWYVTSEKGLRDAAGNNNHSLWYHLQALTWARFADPRTAELTDMRARLIANAATQIAPDGSLPAELTRQNPLGYVVYTLLAIGAATDELERAGITLLEQRADSGALVSDAFGWLAEHHTALTGAADQLVPGRGAVVARWGARRLPGDRQLAGLAAAWSPQLTLEQRVRSSVGMRSWR